VAYFNVNENGKSRGVTVASKDKMPLAPLHRMIYDHLSRFPWLLRGEAKPSSFKDFCSVKGTVFVSGDYEAATDNLSLEVAEVLLESILSSS